MTPSAVAARALGAASILASLAGAAHAGQVLYHNDFETAAGSEWSRQKRTTGALSGFLGRFGDEVVILNLAIPTDAPGGDPGEPGQPGDPGTPGGPIDPPAVPVTDLPVIHGTNTGNTNARHGSNLWVYSLTFDLYLIDSWDGADDAFGDDFFFTKINGQKLFQEYFDNHHAEANFREADDGPRNIGWNDWNDSVYRQIRIDFLIDGDVTDLELKWRGTASQGIEDESWGIDNVMLSRQLVSVPAPASALPLASLALLTRRRRD